jgi:hypothetical protein
MYRVDIEYVDWLKSEIRRINSLDINKIDFYQDNEVINIPKSVIDEFEFTGLNNCDFVTGKLYGGW